LFEIKKMLRKVVASATVQCNKHHQLRLFNSTHYCSSAASVSQRFNNFIYNGVHRNLVEKPRCRTFHNNASKNELAADDEPVQFEKNNSDATIASLCDFTNDSYLQYLEKNVIKKPRSQWNVVVGMSGGVDSSVAAYICKQQNFLSVTGFFMQNWDRKDEKGDDRVCPIEQDWLDVQAVCDKLGITCLRREFIRQYWTNVFEVTLQEYERGTTPNPDVWCNKYIKFDAMLKFVQTNLNADLLVTGHYAQILPPPSVTTGEQQVRLARACDLTKDQSYFLAMVSQQALQRAWFPLGKFTSKATQVRKIASETGMATAQKKESMGICFIGKRDFNEFLSKYIESRKAVFVNEHEQPLPFQCKGLSYYTVGQSTHFPGLNNKWFVYRKDLERGLIFVCPGSTNPLLYKSEFMVNDLHIISTSEPR